MTLVYDNGNWKDITNFYVRNSNSWQEADIVYQKQSGNWKVIYDRGPYTSWSALSVQGYGFSGAFPDGNIADASVSFLNNGMFYGTGSRGDTQEFRFAPESKTPNLYIRYTPEIIPGVPSIFYGTTNAWEQLNLSRSWSLTVPNVFQYGFYSSYGLIEIKFGNAIDDPIVASGYIELSIIQESGF